MSKRKAAPLDPDDVLAGRVKPGAADLLQLIHRENPTGRELGAHETAVRYARKARLQSLLIHRFAGELEVTLDPAQPGTVSLRHRGHERDGCHAVLDALDEEARSWAQRELDMAASAAPGPSARPAAPSRRGAERAEKHDDDLTPEGLVRRAEAAIESYDYDGARGALEQALEASHGAAGPSIALLTLLVETLGDDAGALAIETRIAGAALAEARVRALLALAVARSGDEVRSLAMARGLDDAPAAVVFTALAAGALAAGSLERAAGHVEQARRRDPSCPGLAGVVSEVATARAKVCAPAEAEVVALLAAGRDTEAEQKAGEVLARWPESAAARRALREIEERRRRSEAARLAKDAEDAAAQGDAEVALARLALAAVAARGAEREAIEQRARQLAASAREQREAEQVDQAIRKLEVDDAKEGLAVYLSLDEPLRARVRARSARPELEWIDRMEGGRGGDRAKVDAASALAEAREALTRDPERALTLLAPHDTWLDRVPEARRVTREATAAIRVRRVAAVRAAIDAARAELAAGAAGEALARLGATSLRDLPEGERAEAAALEAAATRVVDRRRRAETTVRLRAAGQLFEARALAEGLAEGVDEKERARWEQERNAIRADIRQRFRIEVDEEPRAAEELGRFRPYPAASEVPWWLTADGRGIVIVRVYERWVVVRVLDRETMLVHPTVLLRTPEPLGDVDVSVCGPTLWLTGRRGAIVEIAMIGWEVRDFRPSSDVAAPHDVVETALLVATEDPSAPRYFWVACRARGESFPERLRIIDLAQRRVVRELSDAWHVTPIAGLDEPRVALTRERMCTLHTPRGVVVPHGRLEDRLPIQELAAHPSVEGFVALVSEPMAESFEPYTETDRWLYLATVSPTGEVVGLAKFPSADPERPSCVAEARGSGLVHGIVGGDEALSLFAMRSGSDRNLTALYDVEIGGATMLVQDAGARRIVALTLHDHGAEAAELGPTPPDLPVRPRQERVEIPRLTGALHCDRPSGARNAAALALEASWRGRSDGEILRQVRGLEQAEAATPEPLVEVVFALRTVAARSRNQEAERMIARLFARFPTHPEVRLLQASEPATAGRWAEVGELLAGVEPADLDASRAQHLHHLRALTALGEGRFTEAREEVTAALALEGHCELDALAELLASVLSTPPGEGAERSPLAELMAAIGAADRCFAARDPAGAQRALDRPVVWRAHKTTNEPNRRLLWS